MKRYMTYVGVLLLAGVLSSCGGGGGGGGSPASAPATNGGTPPPNGGGTVSSATQRFEEDDATVTRSGDWTGSDPHAGWSGGAALEASAKDASVSFSFTGTSVRWIGARSRDGGIAQVKVDGAEVKRVDLFDRGNDEFRTPCFTIYDLTPGPHVLTIVATGETTGTATKVWVDAFEVNPLVVSHIQDSDAAVTFNGTWAQAPDGLFWSGSGVGNAGEPPVGAKVTETKDASVTLEDKARHLNTRGTSISWIGYRGPDAGIAAVSVDGGPSVEVDTYGPVFKLQEVLFTASGLADTEHTLTITHTGKKNPAATAAKIFIDAFDVAKPGKRFEEDTVIAQDSSVTHSITFAHPSGTAAWDVRNSRTWSEGWARTSAVTGASATFTFNGTSVSWIGCEKSTIGSAKVFLDNDPTPVEEVNMNKPVGVESFQRTVFRRDGLAKGPHTLRIEVSSTNSNFVVVDAFDVVE
jgi:hypothetical protein